MKGFTPNGPVVIFLDVDGVLNNEKYIEKCWMMNGHHAMHMNHVPFDPGCLKNLMKLCRYIEKFDYEVKIILSSTWRLHKEDYEIVDARLAEYGLHLDGKTTYKGNNRGSEIFEWIKYNEYSVILILDDDSKDILPYVVDEFIQTNFKYGFDRKCLRKAKRYIRTKLANR